MWFQNKSELYSLRIRSYYLFQGTIKLWSRHAVLQPPYNIISQEVFLPHDTGIYIERRHRRCLCWWGNCECASSEIYCLNMVLMWYGHGCLQVTRVSGCVWDIAGKKSWHKYIYMASIWIIEKTIVFKDEILVLRGKKLIHVARCGYYGK